MRQPSTRRWSMTFALVVFLAVAGLTMQACPPPELAEGTDCWHTEPGTFQRLPTLPANFFGPRSQAIPNPTIQFEGNALDPTFVSDPYPQGCGCPDDVEVEVQWVDRHGSPVAADSAHAVSQVTTPTTTVDTCIRRKTRAQFNRGQAVKVDIELVALSLQSIDPLEVTYRGEPPQGEETTKLFDVFVTQSASQKQQGGTMTFTPGNIRNGRADGQVNLDDLRITYDVRFVAQDGSGEFTKTGLSTRLRSPGGGSFNQP